MKQPNISLICLLLCAGMIHKPREMNTDTTHKEKSTATLNELQCFQKYV